MAVQRQILKVCSLHKLRSGFELKHGDSIIGLFQDMFDKNILTFNPGWNQECNTIIECD